MRGRAFTLIELMVAVIIVGILATLAIGQYQGFIENADAQVCETKQKAIVTFMKDYAMSHDTMPADFSAIPRKDLEKAYAGILRQKGAWRIKLAYFIEGLKDNGIAYAANQQALRDLVRGDASVLVCPRNKRGGISYGINQAIAGMSSREFRQLPDNFLIVADCDNFEFTSYAQLARRHKNYNVKTSNPSGEHEYGYPQGATKDGNSITEIAKKYYSNDPSMFLQNMLSGSPVSGYLNITHN